MGTDHITEGSNLVDLSFKSFCRKVLSSVFIYCHILWQNSKWERLLLKIYKSPPFLPQCKYFNLMNHKLHMRLRCVKYHNVLKTSNICSLEHKRYPWESPLHSFITIIKKKRPVPTASASLQAAHSRPKCFYN